jgi:hypothetical protein
VFNTATYCLLVASKLINQIEISAYVPTVTSEGTQHYLCSADKMSYLAQGIKGDLGNADIMQIVAGLIQFPNFAELQCLFKCNSLTSLNKKVLV